MASLAVLLPRWGFSKQEALSSPNVTYYLPGTEMYSTYKRGFNKRFNRNPSVIAVIHQEAGVAEAIRYANEIKLPVSIKSGGHCMEGFSCNDGSLLIHLGELNQITWLNADTVTMGPACLLASVYGELLPKNRIIPGGSCATVGIGGLVLGGGYGLLARKFGLTCDSLLRVSMIDGKGNRISSDTDPQLLWGCKGGNNGNFGVVTSLTFKTHPAPATMQSFRFRAYNVSADRAAKIMETWFEAAGHLSNDCFSAFVLNAKTLYILITNVGKHDTGIIHAIQRLKAITDKYTQSKATPLPQALSNYFGQTTPIYFKNASAGLYEDFNSIRGCVREALELVTKTPGMIYQVNTLGGKIQDPALAGTSAFPHRQYSFFSELQTYWEQPSREAFLLSRFEQVQQVFSKHGIKAQYRNYPDTNFKNWETAYYGTNYTRLQQLKNKYDPNNTFRFAQSIRNS